MRCLRKRGGRFVRDTRGATAVELAMVIGPMLRLASGTLDFALLLWRTASLDNAALVLHKEIRPRATAPREYQAAFCHAAGSLVSCDDGALTLRVVRLGNSNYDSSRDRVGYSGREEDPFLIRVNYRHAFMTPMANSVLPNRILVTRYRLYGEYE